MSAQAVLVTGGAGFIGSSLVHFLHRERTCAIVTLDKLTYAGNRDWLAGLGERHVFVHGDVADGALVERVCREHRVSAVLNLAAETHVDRSILDAAPFATTNVTGTAVLLEAARRAGVRRFVQVSTDEVYGSAEGDGRFDESSPVRPSSPYAASKAAADLFALAAHHTFGLDVVVVRPSNNYGPRQFPEKLIPLMIANALAGERLPVYGDGGQIREWTYVEDCCAGIVAALEQGRPGEIYNLGAGDERRNVEVVREILRILGKPESAIAFVPDRPGHDRRYALDARKSRTELRWAPRVGFSDGLRRTVDWYLANRAWWERVRSGEFRAYYEKNYGARG